MIKMADKELFVQGNEACALGALAAEMSHSLQVIQLHLQQKLQK